MSGMINKIRAGVSNNGNSSESSLSFVESTIQIIDNGQITTLTLQRCRKLILSRYHKLLIFIGWKPFAQKRMIYKPHFWKFLNILYVTFVMINIVYANVYETLFCEGQVASPIPEPVVKTKLPTTTTAQTTIFSLYDYSQDDWIDHTITNSPESHSNKSLVCHELTIYAIPNTLHFIAFLIGLWYFRIRENEELDVLMETIFLQANYMFGAQERLIKNSKIFLAAGVVWVVMILFASGLAIAAYNVPMMILQKFHVDPEWLNMILAGLQFLGKIFYSCTYIALIVNYTIQCEFILSAIKSIGIQLRERNFELKDSMHEILRVKQLISKMNGSLSKLTSLCITNFSLKVIIGFSILITTAETSAVALLYRILFPLIWTPVMVFPLVQAARVTKSGDQLRNLVCELRVFGYRDCELYDLDSFILFINSAKLRAKLFSMPIKPSYLICTFAFIAFTLLLLFQTNVIHTNL